MDQRLKDLASLVGRLLAENWHRQQQEKERASEEAENPTDDDDVRRTAAPEPG